MEPRISWSHSQRKRLVVEKELLEEYFPGRTSWFDHTDASNTKVEIALNTNDQTEYILRIYLTEDFPSSCPMMSVVSPRLRLRNGNRFPEASTAFHTLLQVVDGYPTICHFHPESWTQENTLYQVFMKGRLWLEAYCLYHKTGEVMDKFLKEFDITPTPEVVPLARTRSRSRFLGLLRRR